MTEKSLPTGGTTFKEVNLSKLKIVCAWCKKHLGEKESDTEGETCGICDDCLLRHFPHHYERIIEATGVANVEKIYQGGDKTEDSPSMD